MFDHNTIALGIAIAWCVFTILRCRAYARAAKGNAQLAATAEGLARGYANIARRAEADAREYLDRAEHAAAQQPAWGFGAGAGGGARDPYFAKATGLLAGGGGGNGALDGFAFGGGPASARARVVDPVLQKLDQINRTRTAMNGLGVIPTEHLAGLVADNVGTTDDEAPETDR